MTAGSSIFFPPVDHYLVTTEQPLESFPHLHLHRLSFAAPLLSRESTLLQVPLSSNAVAQNILRKPNMRFSTAASLVIAAAPLAVSAGGTLGFCLGNVNADGSCKQQSDFEADFQAIGSNSQSKLVRTYSSTDAYGNNCNTPSAVLPAAQSAGFQVLIGIWPDGGAYDAEKQSVQDANVSQYGDTLYGITVGSEGIYRGSYTTTQLLNWISDMSSTFPGVTIGTADSWEGWANGTMDSVISSGIKLV